MDRVKARLAELGLTLPEAMAPVANYVPFVRTGSLIHISGQISIDATGGITGVVGLDVDLERAKSAARLCAVNLIAQIGRALDGDFSRLRRVVRLGGFVQAGPDFFDIPTVVNGASDLMVDVFGEAGRTRARRSACTGCRATSPSRSTPSWRRCDRRDALADADARVPRG